MIKWLLDEPLIKYQLDLQVFKARLQIKSILDNKG